jgi:hypothetical protein
MSVFDQAQQPEGQSQAAEQQAVTTEQQESFLAKLVAVKGDNWKDPEVLAKGKLEADGSESPTAFFALLGEQKKSFSPMVQGSVRTEGVNMQASTERDWNYYQNLRRENKSAYYSPKVQQQLMNDRQRLGSKFGL